MQAESSTTRDFGEVRSLIASIPYAGLLNISVQPGTDGELRGVMARGPMLVGNERFKALHGGALAGLLEYTALAELMSSRLVKPMPARLSINLDYLRSAHDGDTHASAELIRIGKTTCSMRVVAWQADPTKPVAAARVQFLLKG